MQFSTDRKYTREEKALLRLAASLERGGQKMSKNKPPVINDLETAKNEKWPTCGRFRGDPEFLGPRAIPAEGRS
jgi:hypothetical protein